MGGVVSAPRRSGAAPAANAQSSTKVRSVALTAPAESGSLMAALPQGRARQDRRRFLADAPGPEHSDHGGTVNGGLREIK